MTSKTRAKADLDARGDVGVPSGAVMPFAMVSPPTGWLACSGQNVSRSEYPDLFAAIGTLYGAGDGTTTFTLPDLRGEFVRGYDNGRGVDSGRTLGSFQDSDNKAHNHTGSTSSNGAHTHTPPSGTFVTNLGQNRTWGPPGGSAVGYSTTTASAGAHTHSFTTTTIGGTEARPRNIAMLYCIKA